MITYVYSRTFMSNRAGDANSLVKGFETITSNRGVAIPPFFILSPPSTEFCAPNDMAPANSAASSASTTRSLPSVARATSTSSRFTASIVSFVSTFLSHVDIPRAALAKISSRAAHPQFAARSRLVTTVGFDLTLSVGLRSLYSRQQAKRSASAQPRQIGAGA